MTARATTPRPLACPTCGRLGGHADQFCERCGSLLDEARAAVRRHFEIDGHGAAAVSDVGLVRRSNEDAVSLASRPGGFVVAVADGVSASSRADIAAIVAAVGATEYALGHHDGDDIELVVRGAVEHAARSVAQLSRPLDRDGAAPSCTLVVAVRVDQDLAVGWAGDSRAYWVDAQGARRLTCDHSWAQEQIDGGGDAEVAMADHRAHAITRWLGADGDGDYATVRLVAPANGRLVLCTDGLWNMLDDDAIAAVVAGSDSLAPIGVAQQLVEAALGRGGIDNVTVAVVECGDPSGGDRA